MVKLRITKEELEMLLLWGKIARDNAQEFGVIFEADENALFDKLRTACTRHPHEPLGVRG